MKNLRFLLTLIVPLAACSPDGPDTATDPASTEPAVAVISPAAEHRVLTGKQAYEKVCAGCHAEGLNGAPVTGSREDWAERSPLWEAVLFEHANDGFLGMPPKGDAVELTELEVEYAAEYMLGLAYPERPGDPH